MTLADFSHVPQGGAQFPLEYMERRGVIKLEESAEGVLVGHTGPLEPSLISELEFFLSRPIRFVPLPPQDLSEFLGHRFTDGAPRAPERDLRETLDTLAHDAPLVNLVNSILLEGIRRRCSDVHLESHPSGARVRYRIDGILHVGRILPQESFPGVSSRLKIMANLDIIERRLPQDGRMSVQLAGETLEFRISVVPLAEGESIVLRLFQKQGTVPNLSGLGFSKDYIDDLRTSGKSPNGLILITGPTGSGKTTTLNALVQELSNDQTKLLTIEDPVENFLPGVNQIQTNDAIGLSFDTLLRRVLRQDPDILMVGEIRDKTTADLCLRSALTGHLVLSTLHTNDALSSIPRLLNMGVEPYLLAAVLRSCSAQRLVRTLCPDCRVESPPSSAERALVHASGGSIDRLYRPGGCPVCHGTGYRGRTAIGEIYPMDEACEEMIIQGRRHQEFVGYFAAKNRPTLAQDAFRRVADGQISLEELQRVVALS
jgi:type II secretory ATPase GspE/PulE/Tfp pilus assembly ATPase PilB-like protein